MLCVPEPALSPFCPRRSNFQTTRASFSRRCDKASAKPLRSGRVAPSLSVKTRFAARFFQGVYLQLQVLFIGGYPGTSAVGR